MAAQLHHGIIKSVTSGDTIIVMGVDASKGPPPEKLISLSGIAAPRLGNKSSTDAPHAWDAREFLRNGFVGKRVSFQVEAQGTANRAFGAVYLEDGSSLAAIIAQAGWAKPRPGGPPELVDAGAAAEASGVGMYDPANKATALRDVKWAGSFDAAELLASCKGRPLDAIIEQVPSGSMLRVLLLPTFHQVTLMLSGIQCAGFRRNEDNTEEAQPYAREARYFVETRLLNRNVQVLLEGVDKNGSVLGTVVHPQGNISIELVRVGLARVVDWSAQMTPDAPKLRGAERQAKDKRLRLWKDYIPPNHGGDMAEFQAKVIEVVSGDTLIVQDGNSAERRVSLSSLRCPRMGREPEPYAAESKEHLRKILIGKKVKVVPEYKKTFPPTEGQTAGDSRTFAAIIYNTDRNAGLVQVQEGLASVMKHGGSDERSASYELLLEAEEEARGKKKGLHAPSETARSAPSLTDLTKPDARERAKRYVSTFQRHGRVRGVVQFIPNGTRFKLLVPKENCIISFACVGMRCPACARRDQPNTPGEPFGDEALAFARNLAFQRDVDFEVETIDKNGNFLGSLFLADKRNYGVLLVEAGLARLVQPMADRSTCGAELHRAEDAAKKAHLKIWESYNAEEEEAALAAAKALADAELVPVEDKDKQVVELEMTEITDGASFYAQVAGDTAVVALQEKLQQSCRANGVPNPFEPKVGAYCCAKFTADDMWYRAKITARSGAGDYTVFFLDYGNSDVVQSDRLHALEPTLGPKEMSPQALECKLAYLIALPPTDGGDGEEAAHALSGLGWGKSVMARVEERQGDLLHVSLTSGGESINEALLEQGLVRLGKTVPRRAAALLTKLREKEDAARKGRHGMWRYGDIDEDEALEFGMVRQKMEAAKAAAAAPPSAWGKK